MTGGGEWHSACSLCFSMATTLAHTLEIIDASVTFDADTESGCADVVIQYVGGLSVAVAGDTWTVRGNSIAAAAGTEPTWSLASSVTHTHRVAPHAAINRVVMRGSAELCVSAPPVPYGVFDIAAPVITFDLHDVSTVWLPSSIGGASLVLNSDSASVRVRPVEWEAASVQRRVDLRGFTAGSLEGLYVIEHLRLPTRGRAHPARLRLTTASSAVVVRPRATSAHWKVTTAAASVPPTIATPVQPHARARLASEVFHDHHDDGSSSDDDGAASSSSRRRRRTELYRSSVNTLPGPVGALLQSAAFQFFATSMMESAVGLSPAIVLPASVTDATTPTPERAYVEALEERQTRLDTLCAVKGFVRSRDTDLAAAVAIARPELAARLSDETIARLVAEWRSSARGRWCTAVRDDAAPPLERPMSEEQAAARPDVVCFLCAQREVTFEICSTCREIRVCEHCLDGLVLRRAQRYVSCPTAPTHELLQPCRPVATVASE